LKKEDNVKIFLVSWVVSIWIPTQCPDYKPNVYTGQYPQSICSVNHGKYVNQEMSKEFKSLIKANKFIKDSPQDYGFKITEIKGE
jgi:hypothetical protein